LDTSPTIGATARVARQVSDGSWVTLELSASRHVDHADPDDDIPEARRLGRQLHHAVEEIFGDLYQREKVVGALAAKAARVARPSPDPRAPAIERGRNVPAQLDCPEHPGSSTRVRFRADSSHYYSHNDESTGGNWCNYQPRST